MGSIPCLAWIPYDVSVLEMCQKDPYAIGDVNIRICKMAFLKEMIVIHAELIETAMSWCPFQ